MKLEFTRTPNGFKCIVDNNLRVKEYLSIPSFDQEPTADDLNDNDPDEPAIGFYQGTLMLWDGTQWVEAGGGLKVEDIGQGLTFDSNGKLTLDLDTTTLVSPTITNSWTLKKNNGTDDYSPASSNSTALTVDKGVIATLSAYYRYPAAGAGQALPTGKSGDFPGSLPGPNVNSPTLAVTYGQNVQNTKSYAINLTKPKSGLIVVSNQVKFASGSDSTSDSISIAFKGRSCLVSAPSTSLTAAQIQAFLNTGAGGNSAFVDSRARTFTGFTASNGYTYYLLDQSFGRPSAVSQDGVDAVFGAFQFLADVTIVNSAGLSVPITVMRSNAPNAFNNRSLAFS